ncbi:hypothetical protein [Sinorhizobium meliloti]|uniref:hypothetical protein n=1 Tax=Rhizobium meliloti TaxID=382 RepID=UPI002380BEFC|nr:hypothetical protein [Sinorhizobium meliloti]MDE3768648.1 hypothetical protein [Sinorhizobium meliloti]
MDRGRGDRRRAVGVGYWKGRADIRADQLKDTIRAIEKGSGLMNGFKAWTAALCNELLGGGVHDECQQLRGVEEDTRHPGRRR